MVGGACSVSEIVSVMLPQRIALHISGVPVGGNMAELLYSGCVGVRLSVPLSLSLSLCFAWGLGREQSSRPARVRCPMHHLVWMGSDCTRLALSLSLSPPLVFVIAGLGGCHDPVPAGRAVLSRGCG